MVFPVVMYGCESWTVKKAERWRTDAFELWCWRRLLRFPWTARRSNQSILKEISPGCSLEGLMLNLKLQYFSHVMRRAVSFEKTLILGKIEGQEKKGTTEDEMFGRHYRLNGQGFGWTLGVGDGQGGLACCNSWGHKESDTTEWLNWTDTNLDCVKTSFPILIYILWSVHEQIILFITILKNYPNVLAWRIPETLKPGGLLSMGSHSWTRLKPLSSSSSRDF